MTSPHNQLGLGTVLGIWAHPDDEAYLMAGTALAAARTGSVACLTATAGEAGETADEDLWPQRRLADIRRTELLDSLAILGITNHTELNLPDGGLDQIEDHRGTQLVATVIDRVQPDTILTFANDGITGHPDHVTIGGWAVEAAYAVRGDRCRVLAATKTPEWLKEFRAVNEGMILAGGPPCTDPEDLALHVRLTGADLDRKIAALQAQASQTTALIAALGEDTYRSWLADEFWVDRTQLSR